MTSIDRLSTLHVEVCWPDGPRTHTAERWFVEWGCLEHWRLVDAPLGGDFRWGCLIEERTTAVPGAPVAHVGDGYPVCFVDDQGWAANPCAADQPFRSPT